VLNAKAAAEIRMVDMLPDDRQKIADALDDRPERRR
jgi:hypothetical protein